MILFGAGLAQAQSIDVSANFGVFTRNDFRFEPLILATNVTIDIFAGSFIMISPECTLYSSTRFASDSLILAPGGTVNFTSGQLFAGAGIVKELWLRSSDVTIPLEMKIQVGIRARKYRLGAYMLTSFEDLFKEKSFGFTLGFAL
jgi:hypothetical protein